MTLGPLAEQVRRFKALGHPARLRLAVMLAGGELCVCQMTAVVGLAASTVSAHLAELRRAGLVRERKEGRWVFYGLDEEGRRLLASVAEVLAADARVREDAGTVSRLRALGPEALCRVGSSASPAMVELPVERRHGKGRPRRPAEDA